MNKKYYWLNESKLISPFKIFSFDSLIFYFEIKNILLKEVVSRAV